MEYIVTGILLFTIWKLYKLPATKNIPLSDISQLNANDADFIAIDFETATAKRNSACAIGLVAMKDSSVIGTFSQLIRPPGNRYDPLNIRIHKITPQQTAGAPTFKKLWVILEPIFLSKKEIVAHSTGFDMSVLRSSLEEYNIKLPYVQATCTLQLSRDMFPNLRNHKLKTVSKHLGISLNHHDATSDAHASAQIMAHYLRSITKESQRTSSDTATNKLTEKNLAAIAIIKEAKLWEENMPDDAVRQYFQAIKILKGIDIQVKKNGVKTKRVKMPINRLTLVLERSNRYVECNKIFKWYSAYKDQVMLPNADKDAILSREKRIQKYLP